MIRVAIPSSSSASGSYSYAELYRYNVSADTLSNKLKSLKEKDTTLMPPAILHLMDGKRDSSDYWYRIYFYNKKKNEIIFTWVREEGSQTANLAFVGVNEGVRLGNWKYINKDYSETENNNKKEEFKNLILSGISDMPVK